MFLVTILTIFLQLYFSFNSSSNTSISSTFSVLEMLIVSSEILYIQYILLNLSTNILRLSKIQNQGKIVRKDHINITEQLRKAIAVLENKWNEKSLTFNISAKDVYYDGDEELTFQVWMNLIDNAIKFSKQNGKITIDVKEENEEVVVKIKDNGMGMSKEEQERIFTRFYQIDKSHSQEGSGLGLSIVKSIIDLSDGKIEVESKENSGTTFTIKLPIEKENNKIII